MTSEDALDRMDTIARCHEAIGDLMNPDSDAIQFQQRDHIAILLGFLRDEYIAAREHVKITDGKPTS